MKQLIIGISGKKCSGKTRAAGTICNTFKQVMHESFSLGLKREVGEVLGLLSTVRLDTLKNTHPSIRKLLITWGQEKRAEDPDYWIKKIEKTLRGDFITVISDVRFKNEAVWIKSKGGYLWRVERPNFPLDENSTDASETALDDYTGWDSILLNNSTVADYDKLVVHTFFRTYSHFHELPL